MRWLVLSLLFLGSVSARCEIEPPFVLQAGGTNELPNAPAAKALWLNFDEPKRFAVISIGGKSIVQFSAREPAWLDEIMACRVLANGRWSSIRPVLVMANPFRSEKINFPGYIPGRIKENEILRLQFRATRDTPVHFDVVAKRIASQLDPLIVIRDSKGSELPTVRRGTQGSRDPFISFTPKRTGQYWLELRDVGYSGGPNFTFVLRAAQHRVDYDAIIDLPDVNEAKTPEEKSFTMAEQGFNARDSRLTLPVGVFKSVPQPGGVEEWKFHANAGQKIIVSAETRKIRRAGDMAIVLMDEIGKAIAESVGLDAFGPSITNRFSSDGIYRVKVREITRDPMAGVFWLSIKESVPGIVLTSEVERIDFSKDGEAKLKIACERYDYIGPVKLKVDGLPEGVTLVEDTIGKGQKEGELKLKRTSDMPGFQIRVNGEIEGKEPKSFPVSTMPALRKLFPMQLFPSAAMDGWIAVNPP